MTPIIHPTVGRVVWYRTKGQVEPLAATVAKVHSDTCVNLFVIGEDGVPFNKIKVRLLQDGDHAEAFDTYCCWMPYQKSQAAKYEALEKQLAG